MISTYYITNQETILQELAHRFPSHTMALMSGKVIYESGEDRKPEWTAAKASYNEEGKVGV